MSVSAPKLEAARATTGREPWLRHGGASDLYPTTVGRTWTYQTHQTQGEAPEKPGKEQRLEISRHVPDGAVMRRFYGSWEAPATLIRKSAEEVRLSRFFADAPSATESIAILRFPLQVGAVWPGRSFPRATESIEVVGQERITVPAGTFDAWHLRHVLTYAAGGGDDLDYWYAAGVGMVQAIERVTLMSGEKPLHTRVRALLAGYGPMVRTTSRDWDRCAQSRLGPRCRP